MLYEHIFFDLDNTIWDLEKNSEEALSELVLQFNLFDTNLISITSFVDYYKKTNQEFWELYSKDMIDREVLRLERFKKTFNYFNINDDETLKLFSKSYTFVTPQKPHLVEGALDLLNYLKPKYQLHILSNGFEDIQEIKLNYSGIKEYFTHVITPDKSGFKKPHINMFKYALETAGAKAENSMMIGDDLEPDIIGANRVGMDAAFFNRSKMIHEEKLKIEIFNLKELESFL